VPRQDPAEEERRQALGEDYLLALWEDSRWAKECKNPKKEKKEEAHVAQVDDDEPTLFMVMFCVLHDVELELEAEEEVVAAKQGKVSQAIHLDELHAQVHLGRVGGGMEQKWYMDSGASNHMTGSKEAMFDLDGGVTGLVKFGDGSKVEVRGHGIIIF
jgi:hypothetical protein